MIRRGDLLLFLSYVPDGDGYRDNGMDSKEPCLCIARKTAGGERRCWAIPLSSAWRYCNPDGYPTTWAYQRCTDIAEHLGMGDGVHARRQIWGAIGDYLPDLIQSPEFDMVQAERHRSGPAIGEVAAYVEGELVGGAEMMH